MPDFSNPELMQCADCDSHFQISPRGEIQLGACPDCGGKRMFRMQPNPVHSEGVLRNMVDMETGKDAGGNPDAEGILAPASGRAILTAVMSEFIHDPRIICPTRGCGSHDTVGVEGNSNGIPHTYGFCRSCGMNFRWPKEEEIAPIESPAHPDPWMDNEPGTTTFPENWTSHLLTAFIGDELECPTCHLRTNEMNCPRCGMFIDPTGIASEHSGVPAELRSQVPGAPLTEGTIMGAEHTDPYNTGAHGRDEYAHSHIIAAVVNPMQTLRCPQCGGGIMTDAQQGDVFCTHCDKQWPIHNEMLGDDQYLEEDTLHDLYKYPDIPTGTWTQQTPQHWGKTAGEMDDILGLSDLPQKNNLNWTPGMRGRGIMIGGEPHTWNTVDPSRVLESDDSGLLHPQYIESLGVNPEHADWNTGIEIDPDGKVVATGGHDSAPFIAADPRLKHVEDKFFSFSSIMPILSRTNNMEPYESLWTREADAQFDQGPLWNTHSEAELDRNQADKEMTDPSAWPPEESGPAYSVVVQPSNAGVHGAHTGRKSMLSFLDAHINGIPVRGHGGELITKYGFRTSPEFGKPVVVAVHDPAHLPVAVEALRHPNGHISPETVAGLMPRIQQGQIAAPPGIDPQTLNPHPGVFPEDPPTAHTAGLWGDLGAAALTTGGLALAVPTGGADLPEVAAGDAALLGGGAVDAAGASGTAGGLMSKAMSGAGGLAKAEGISGLADKGMGALGIGGDGQQGNAGPGYSGPLQQFTHHILAAFAENDKVDPIGQIGCPNCHHPIIADPGGKGMWCRNCDQSWPIYKDMPSIISQDPLSMLEVEGLREDHNLFGPARHGKTADYETPGSNPDVGVKHDDPEDVDQKEFNDQDKSPENPMNPNLQDSGASGEDEVRKEMGKPSQGQFSENSPSIQRMDMLMPLIEKYYNSDESGANDPMLKGLHEMLEAENPGYLNGADVEAAERFMHNKKTPGHVHAQTETAGWITNHSDCGHNNQHIDADGEIKCHDCGGVFRPTGVQKTPMYQQLNEIRDLPVTDPRHGHRKEAIMPPMQQGNLMGQQQALDPTALNPSMQPGAPSSQTPPGGMHQQGHCPNCGGVTQTDGSCPQCGAAAASQAQPLPGGPSMALHPQTFAHMDILASFIEADFSNVKKCPKCESNNLDAANKKWYCNDCGWRESDESKALPAKDSANHQGPVTPEQIAAVQQFLIQEGRVDEVPNVPLDPGNPEYAKILAEIQGNPNVPPTVTPEEQTQPPPPQPSAPGGMPVPGMAPGEAGGQPMQPMSSFLPDFTAADNIAPRCPQCGSATTGLVGDSDHHAKCHSCHNVWQLGDLVSDESYGQTSIARTALHDDRQHGGQSDQANPVGVPAAEQEGRLNQGGDEDSSLTWKDSTGAPLKAGQQYQMVNPSFSLPDLVRVERVKPDGIDVTLLGTYANDPSQHDPNTLTSSTPISKQDMELQQLSFEPVNQTADDQNNEPPPGSMAPGHSQVPPSGQTTDEQAASEPQMVAQSRVEDDCPRCGHREFTSSMIAPEATEHSCFRCGHDWVTEEKSLEHKAGVDLGWLNEDDNAEDLSPRHAQMARATMQSRSISDIAEKDERLRAVREHLQQEKTARTERLAGKHFTPREQRELIDEDGIARNSDMLDLEKTHYKVRDNYNSKTNPERVRDADLFLGV